MSQIQKRLLMIDHSLRPTIFALLMAALIINYVTNIIFGVIFYKYIYPLIKNPRQVDYITIGLALVVGMLTNYRFTLIIFSKMFPKPQVDVDYSSRLTPVHYLCVASVFLSGISLAASGLIINNQYPLTDIFMLGLDILLIELILILFTIWMVSCDKPSSYYEAQIKKYHIEEIYRTEQAINGGKDQRNNSKHNLNIKDDFQEKYEVEDNCDDTINFDKRLLDKMSTLNMTKAQIPESDNQKPLARVSRAANNNIDFSDVKLRSSNKVQNTFDNTDISGLSFSQPKNKKINKTQSKQQSQPVKKYKQNVIDFDKKNENQAIIQSAKKFETSDQDNLPKTLEKKNPNDNILANINEPSSDQIPNLPLNDSVFHERISSQFGQKMKPKKILSKANQKSQIIKNKSPLKKDNRNQSESNRSQLKHNMKKKNKFFESEVEGTSSQAGKQEDVVDMKDLDFQSIIKSKIVVIGSKNTIALNNSRGDSMGNQNNISSIQRKQEENSDFNEEISPSWFNIQNQRFDFSSIDSDFAQK